MSKIAYKTLLTSEGELCFAVLEIPEHAQTTEGRSGVVNHLKANYRCSEAKVLDIHTFDGRGITHAFSQYDPEFKYEVGQTVRSKFEPNIERLYGAGIHYFLSQVVYIYDLKKIKYNGYYVWHSDEGVKKTECTYLNGEKHGDYTSYWDDGSLLAKGSFVNGERDGKYVTYYSNGQLELDCMYSNGKPHGHYVAYEQNGEIRVKSDYVNGQVYRIYNIDICKKFNL